MSRRSCLFAITKPLRHLIRVEGTSSVILLSNYRKKVDLVIPHESHPFVGLGVVQLTPELLKGCSIELTPEEFLSYYENNKETRDGIGFIQRFNLLEDEDGVTWIGAKYSHSDQCGLWDEYGRSRCPRFAHAERMFETLQSGSGVKLAHVTTHDALRSIQVEGLKSQSRAFICAMKLLPGDKLPEKAISGKFRRREYSKVLLIDTDGVIASGTRILVAGNLEKHDVVFQIMRDVPPEHFEVRDKHKLL
jgi:hypothetical protein